MKKNEDSLLIEKAAQQILADVLGFDEGRAYYLLLTKKEREFEEEFSYSKRYRLMKSLFDLGAMAKIREKNNDSFTYAILPPTFLYSSEVYAEVLSFLEKSYLENYGEMLGREFLQMMLMNQESLILFLLKYITQKNALLNIGSAEFNRIIDYLGDDESKIKLVDSRQMKTSGIIDNQMGFELVNIGGYKEQEFIFTIFQIKK